MSELLALGISHKTAPVELRERLAISDARLGDVLDELRGAGAAQEAVAISTCNRTELYLVAGDPVAAETAALGTLARQAETRPTELAPAIYALRNCDAARHLFRVTTGLDSMIVGEAEVQGQVKRAYDAALRAGATGPLSNRLFHAALATGKRARSETRIGAGALSVSSVAVGLAREVIGDLAERHVIILGAGETSELTARALADEGVRTIFVANRRRDRALSLAERFGGQAVSFDALPEELAAADIVLAATASPHPIVGAQEIAEVMRTRPDRPLLLIDLAVPRDIDAGCGEVPGVTLYDIDDLQGVIASNRSVRAAEARRVEGIIEQEIGHFARWLGSLDALPTLAALREQGTAIAHRVVEENAGRWESASDRDLERVEAIARTVVNRLLHQPTLRLKRAAGERAHARIEVLRELFALDEDGAAPAAEDDGQAPLADVRALPRRRAAE
jgi:glutamyl-tRNA reductase